MNELIFPKFVHVVLTYQCNSRCIMCPYTHGNLRNTKIEEMGSFMNPRIFYRIVTECGENNSFVRITGGGEPFLHPGFKELIEYIKNRKVASGIITNGSLLSRAKAKPLLEANSVIEISVDGADENTYERVRKGLKWGCLIENITDLKKQRAELNSTSPIIVSVVNQKGVDINSVKEFWEDIVDYVIIRKFLTWGVISDELSADTEPLLEDEKGGACPYPFERITIDLDGTFRLCNYDILGKVSLGNIEEKSIKEVWNGDRLQKWRRAITENNWDRIPLCRDCRDRIYRSWNYDYKKVLKDAKKKAIAGSGNA